MSESHLRQEEMPKIDDTVLDCRELLEQAMEKARMLNDLLWLCIGFRSNALCHKTSTMMIIMTLPHVMLMLLAMSGMVVCFMPPCGCSGRLMGTLPFVQLIPSQCRSDHCFASGSCSG